MIWRPFTQEKNTPPPLKAVRGGGIYIYTDDGEKYADMISSWWVSIHGHAKKEIAEAISQQAQTLEQVIFTTFSHKPAEDLVNNLKTVLPNNLNRFFFSDNGSTAVEVALKMAYQFFKNNGESQRKVYLQLEGAYHGDTYGSMSVSGKNSMYHFNFADFFFETISIEVPEVHEDIENVEQKEDQIIKDLERLLQQRGEEICALIVEPLLQGARGMIVYRPEFLERLVRTVRKFNILVIFDEVFTGFYRTGRFFAMDYINDDTKPDIVCLSKALTGGFLPLSLTVATDSIYAAFLSDDPNKALIHGHSFTGNPIACAAANKSFEILRRPETVKRIKEIENFHRSAHLEGVQNRRTLGVMSAFDMPSPQSAKDLVNAMMCRGVFLRPLGRTIYLLPPYCTTLDELDWVYRELQTCL